MIKPNESEAAAGDLWRGTLASIDSVFGRLVYLSSLRNPNSGRYEHFGLAQMHGSRKTDRALREAHRRTFSGWLRFTLREQWSDLADYLGSLTVDRRLVLRAWERQATYQSLIPPDADDVERQLYLCDFEMIVAVMRSACEVPGSPSAFRPTVRCFS